MELSGWLERTRTPRSAFARAVGVSPGRITQICEGELPSLELAERIAKDHRRRRSLRPRRDRGGHR
jgi:transcriptional regulator with XRE-family HTH domain